MHLLDWRISSFAITCLLGDEPRALRKCKRSSHHLMVPRSSAGGDAKAVLEGPDRAIGVRRQPFQKGALELTFTKRSVTYRHTCT